MFGKTHPQPKKRVQPIPQADQPHPVHGHRKPPEQDKPKS